MGTELTTGSRVTMPGKSRRVSLGPQNQVLISLRLLRGIGEGGGGGKVGGEVVCAAHSGREGGGA